MKGKIFLSAAICSALVFTSACNMHSDTTSKKNGATPKPSSSDESDFKVWAGPGWYYGVYFSSEASYKNWQRDQKKNGMNHSDLEKNGKDMMDKQSPHSQNGSTQPKNGHSHYSN